jgi:hypothetical protein
MAEDLFPQKRIEFSGSHAAVAAISSYGGPG